jgi:peptide/nickel transport system permease protein
LGLDRPLAVQYGRYVGDLLQGDLGVSYVSRKPVVTEMLEALPATLELIFFAMVLAVLIGIVLGVLAARYKNRLADHVIRVLTIGGISLPSFWFALALQLVFYGILHALPLGGRVSPMVSALYDLPHNTGFLLLDCLIDGNGAVFADALSHMILPALPLMLYPLGLVARMTRSGLLEILSEDYILAEKSYGISERFILWFYAFKNSLGPTTTVVALSVGYTITNTFLVESIFSWPGIGRYLANAVTSMDYPAIMGVTIFSATVYMLLNLVADLIVALDPRIRV